MGPWSGPSVHLCSCIFKLAATLWAKQSLKDPKSMIHRRGAIRGKTSKTAVLPRFCKIEHGSSSGDMPPCYGGLTLPFLTFFQTIATIICCLRYIYRNFLGGIWWMIYGTIFKIFLAFLNALDLDPFDTLDSFQSPTQRASESK